MALNWEDQKMNIITGAVVLVVGGMVAYHLHLFGMGESSQPSAKQAPAAFASTSTSAAPALPTPAAAAPVPASAAAQPNSVNTGLPVAPGSYGGSIPANPGSMAPGPTVQPLATAPASSAVPTQTTERALHHLQGQVTVLQNDMVTLTASMARMQQQQMAAKRQFSVQLQALATQRQGLNAVAVHRTRSEIAGYRLQSIATSQAWLTNPDGQTVIVRAGMHLPGLSVLAIAPYGVKTGAGWLGF